MTNQEKPSVNNTEQDSPLPKEFLDISMLVKDLCCPFSEKAVRFHIRKSGINGLAPAIFRIGKKILVKRSEWIKWIESHSQLSIPRILGEDSDRTWGVFRGYLGIS